MLAGVASGLLGLCGPFTDVAADAFCPFVLEIFYLGITTGTTATTYDPTSNVTRLQMAAFLSRTVDGALKRGSRRAALDQYWTTQNGTVLGLTTVGTNPNFVASDGTDLWVSNNISATISRVRAADGRLLETWTAPSSPQGILAAMGKVFVVGFGSPSRLARIDPSQPPGGATLVSTNLGGSAVGIAFDGSRIWTANGVGSVSIVTVGPTVPWTTTTVTTGFDSPIGAVFDGTNIWVTDAGPDTLLKLDANGAILQTVTLAGSSPLSATFDGTNIWVPVQGGSVVAVVRPSTGAVLATLTGNGLSAPAAAAFDGERMLITNAIGDSVSLWKAASLAPLGSFSLTPGSGTYGACSDGINFWITLHTTGQLARF